MTPAEEALLFLTDYAAWCRFIAPRWRDMLLALTDPAAKKALWSQASERLQAEIRALRETTLRMAA